MARGGRHRVETHFQAEVIEAFRARGALTFNVHGHAMQASGWPDIQVYHPEWTGHLELKRNKNPATTIQRIILRKLNLAGTPAYILREVGPRVFLESHDGEVLGETLWPTDKLDRANRLLRLLTAM
jgi:hypothetical protein